MGINKKIDISTEIEKLTKKKLFHQEQAQKNAVRLKKLLDQNRNNHLMAFGVGIELKYLHAKTDADRLIIKEEFQEIFAGDDRMMQRAMDGLARLDKQIAAQKPVASVGDGDQPAEKTEQEDDLQMLLALGLDQDIASQVVQTAKAGEDDLRAFVEKAGQRYDKIPDSERHSTREKYIQGAIKKGFKIS